MDMNKTKSIKILSLTVTALVIAVIVKVGFEQRQKGNLFEEVGSEQHRDGNDTNISTKQSKDLPPKLKELTDSLEKFDQSLKNDQQENIEQEIKQADAMIVEMDLLLQKIEEEKTNEL